MYTWRRSYDEEGTSGEVKIDEERGEEEHEIEAKSEKRGEGGGRRMNGGESRIVVQTFHHPYEGSR